jgi:hypothetical protein
VVAYSLSAFNERQSFISRKVAEEAILDGGNNLSKSTKAKI